MSMLTPLPQPSTTLREVALFVWASYLNVPYRWGGDDPLAGVDCSGLVLEGLKAVGKVRRQDDFTADAILHQLFHDRSHFPLLLETELRSGCLLFWKRGSKIGHVEIVWTRAEGELLTIGASGGGSRTKDRAAAIRDNSYVKIRRASPKWVAAIDPFEGR